jgi:selenocysteine-specific elongation factor
VVTGTLAEGTITVGDRLELDGTAVRVRGLESMEVPREHVSGVARVAVDLGGHAPEGIERGRALVTPGSHPPRATVDVRLRGEGAPPERPVLHVGSASQQVRVRPLAQDLVRLQLAEPLPLRNADRAVLRDPGSRTVWGVRVLDAAPPPLVRRGDAARRALVLSGLAPPPAPAPEPAPEPAKAPDPAPDPAVEAALERLTVHLAGRPFAAPDAAELAAIGLDDATAARLHRAGRVLRVAPGIVLLPGADEEAATLLAQLESPFTTSAARQALGTSRRVALPLLAHLDKTGRTVRLADDTRRLRG